jgi:DNA repair protein RadD
MTFELRPYQSDSVDAVINHIKKRLSPCLIELCTGAGKSLIVSAIAKYLKSVAPEKRVLCIAPSRELILQNHSKYVTWYKEPASIYCSSAGSKELRHQVIFASPLTAMKNIRIIAHLGVSGIIIDEAHGVTPTMLELIKQVQEYEVNGTKPNENVRVIGMTATPYRTGTGYIYAKDCTGENEILHDDSKARDPYYSRLLYRVSAGELVEQGYLTKPIIGETDEHYDTSKLETDRNGSFTSASVAKAFNGNTKTERIVNKVMSFAENRKGVMFFAATISHAEEIASYLPSHDVRVITGKLKKSEREKFINDFKARRVKYLVNVDVLTTGFDAPHVDLIAILRATESPGLLQQIIGRSLRLCEGKEDALVLDYAENIERHGLESDIFTPEIKTNRKPGEGIEIQVECPACHAISMKKRRNDPIYDGVAHDQFGNFLVPGTERATRYDAEGKACEWDGEVMTMKVKDPSRKDEFGDIEELDLPMPAHYSRRCSNPEAFVIKGQPVRCEHRFSLKICPKCFAENDIAARHCTDCKERLVDPNSKLTDAAGFASVMMDGEIRRVKCYSATYTPWIAKSSGNHSLKAEYRTEIGEVTAWHTMRQKWIFKKLAQINGADSELITSYDQCAAWNNSPREITIRKTEQNGYVKFEIKQVHYSERVGA